MSDASVTITRDALPEGQDYAVLLERGIDLVQSLSGKIWTNYNASDPGLTVLQQLCYALTELSYRAQFPVEQLLAPEADGRLMPQLHGLLPPELMLPRSPVTAADHARLMLDRVAGLANCWFTPVVSEAGAATGLYDVALLEIEAERPSTGTDDADLPGAVRDCYAAHRALCEDLRTVQRLRPVTTDLAADVYLSQQADSDDVLAQLLFRLHLRLAPEPRRSSLQDLLAAGMETTRIFSGPAMSRGFILDEQLAPQPGTTPVAELLNLMVMTGGVLEVQGLSVHLMGERKILRDDDSIVLSPGTYCRLRTRPIEGRFGIRLHCGAARVTPNPQRVQRLFLQYLTGQRRSFDLRAEIAAHYQRPWVRRMDLATYTSVQEQFPAVYGIGAHGLPKEATAMRQAQALQLKGYLMPFDQLMADHASQLAFVGQLFSVAAGGRSTYACQSLAPIVPDAAALLEHHYAERHAQDVTGADPVIQRQSAMLDFLLSLYARTLARPPLSSSADVAQFRQTWLRTQQCLMARIVAATAERGRGFNPLAPHGSVAAMAGLEIVARAELRLLQAAEGQSPPHEVDDASAASFGHRLPPDAWAALAHVESLETAPGMDALPERGVRLRHLAGQAVAAPLLKALAEPRHFRLLRQAGPCWRLVCGSLEHGWWTLGDFPAAAAAIKMAGHLVREARQHRHVDSLYIVEWVLLRFATPAHDGDDDEVGQPFRVTAVLPLSADADELNGADPAPGERYRRQSAQAILRDNLPAHVALDCLFLPPPEMLQFAALHHDWLSALRDPEAPVRRAHTCRALTGFLQRHLPPPPPPLKSGVLETTPRRRQPHAYSPSADAVPAGQAPSEPDGDSALRDRLQQAVLAAQAKLEQDKQVLADAARAKVQQLQRESSAKLAASPLGQVQAWVDDRRGDAEPRDRQPAVPVPVPTPVPPPSNPSRPAPAEASTGRPWARLKAWLQQRRAAPTDAAPATAEPAPDATPTPRPAPAPLPRPAAPAEALSGALRHGRPGELGFDCNQTLSEAHAQEFRKAGFVFALRYLSRSTPGASHDLTFDEASTITASGLGLMAVQHVMKAGWSPTAALGTSQGQAAAANAQAAGLPPGINVWLDLEGVAQGTAAQDVADYCNAWLAEVAPAGYLPGLYVGSGAVLDGEQLYEMLSFTYYWRSGSNVPEVATRGYCMVQTIDASFEIDEVAYDSNEVQADELGHVPVWALKVTTPAGEQEP